MFQQESDRYRRDVGWMPYAWLVYLLFFVAPLVAGHPTRLQVGASIAAIAVFLPLYFAAFRTGGRRQLIIAWAIHAIGAAVAPINPAAICFFIYAAAFVGFASRPPAAIVWIALMLLSIVAQAFWLPLDHWTWLPAITVTGIVGVTNISVGELRRKDRRLRLAETSVAEMARIAERERIGRDLHDLLGHTLSVIVLKSELASRLADRDPERAVAEIRDVERISREALGEVRKAVRGYRSEGLLDEVANAERVLVAAGITPEIAMAPGALPPDEDRALAFALREAVTNVVRHASARRCWIRLSADGGRTVLEVRDDGRGGLAPEGSGLSGIRERLREVAGTLERDGRQGTRLVMSLPAPRSAS
jgi:two-component system sensor histidine kinase DesK